jgi:hypothetical protein
MANRFLASRFAEIVHRLALGVEAVDALRNSRIPHPLTITFDEVPLGSPRPQVMRHDSAAYALLFGPRVGAEIVIRMFDSATTPWTVLGDRRRYVPRRLRIPLLLDEEADAQPISQRVRRPVLFPGAAYDVSECATGMRGRVLRDGEVVRWARVQAIHPDTGETVGIAHCDDRGEFLLVVDSNAGGIAELTNPLPLQLHVHVPTPPVASDEIRRRDPLWDLPVEEVAAPGDPDTVCAGSPPWDEWTDVATVATDFTLGTLMRGVAPLTV